MAWKVTADPERFEEAIEWFDDRFPLTQELKDSLGKYAGKRAWTVAGVAQLDVVLEVFDSIRSALSEGTSLADWKRDIRKRVGDRWGSKTSARLDTIFRTNVQTAYNRGRWQQMKDPDVVDVRPYWMYDAILDDRRTPICKSLSTPKPVVLPQDDPFWDSHVPPLHFQCRSSLRALTAESAKRRGITGKAPDEKVPEGFGNAPTEEDWKPDPDKYPSELFEIFEEKQAKRK